MTNHFLDDTQELRIKQLRCISRNYWKMEGAKSLQKALALLRLFTPANPTRTGPELAGLTGMHKTSTYRMLATLCHERFLERNEATGEYSVGSAIYELGSLYLSTNTLLRAARPVVQLLNELTKEATNLSILEDGYITLVMREESKYEFRWGRHVGSVMPAHPSAMGKALLSELSEEEIDAIYPGEQLEQVTPNSPASKTQLKAELAEIRRTGVSFDFEGSAQWVVGIGAVVRNHTGRAVAAVSVALPTFRLDEDIQLRLAGIVKRGAGLISYRLGHTGDSIEVRDLDDLHDWWVQMQLIHATEQSRSGTRQPSPLAGED